ELFQRVRVALRRWRVERDPTVVADLEARIIDDAGILGHYIADASQPLHTTIHNNGWAMADNRHGFSYSDTIHIRFEHEYVRAQITDADVRRLMAQARGLGDPLQSIHDEMRRANDLVIHVYELEQSTPFGAGNTQASAKALVAGRLAD